MEHAIWTLTAPAWQWIVGGVVALWVWEVWLEHVFYRLKHWVFNKAHSTTIKRNK